MTDSNCLQTESSMTEWGIMAATFGIGCVVLGRSKKLGQVEQAARQLKANRSSFSFDINRMLQSHEYAGGFKDKMDKAEALKILGCTLDAADKEVNTKYRSLMIANHPDKGGSPYVSTKINEAKDLLTGKNKGSVFGKDS